MNALEKDKIFTLYYNNKFKELMKIIKNKDFELAESTNSFGENIAQYFIADQKYDLLAITLKYHKKNLNDPTQLLTELLEDFKTTRAALTKKVEQYRIKDFLESVNILTFHPLISPNSDLITNIGNVTNMTTEYPSVLSEFLNKNKIHLNEIKKFLNCVINIKPNDSIKIDFKLEIKSILEKKIMENTVQKKKNNKTILKV